MAGRSKKDSERPGRRSAEFRFYEELNDFLPRARRKRAFEHRFDGTPSVKDRIEALGVPHTEVDLILVDGKSVDFTHRLQGGERVAVYPVFEALDIGPVTRLRPKPLRVVRFILDVHLGRLAAYLRFLGFDAAWSNGHDDETLIDRARAEKRILLTRDFGILKDGRVTHGAFVHARSAPEQTREVIRRFQLEDRIRPCSRCMACNAPVRPEAKDKLAGEVPAGVLERFDRFNRCTGCGKAYWEGGHLKRLKKRLEAAGVRLHNAG